MSIQETTGVLSLFAQNGTIGAEAGTQLNSMLMKLAAPSNDAAATMKELGISADHSGLWEIADDLPLGTPVIIYNDADDPGPIGKPGTIYTDPADTEKRGWDPTDPDPANPWTMPLRAAPPSAARPPGTSGRPSAKIG